MGLFKLAADLLWGDPNREGSQEPPAKKSKRHTKPHHGRIQEVLDAAEVKGRVQPECVTGAIVTRYFVRMEVGATVRQLETKAVDFSRDLRMAPGDQILITPNAGNGLVAIDVPNSRREDVSYARLLTSKKWKQATKDYVNPWLLGRTIDDKPLIVDLCNHCMTSGQPRSGKSMGLRAQIAALMSCRTPEQVRFWMVDTKFVELAPYDDSPYLMDPVATEGIGSVELLNKAIVEMNRRYQLMHDQKVRKIQQLDEPLPTIIFIHEELGDVLTDTTVIDTSNGKQVGTTAEQLTTQLAQKGAAAGVYFYCLIQNPSSKILGSGLRGNLPLRIAYKVTDSSVAKTAMGVPHSGAEHLLGNGDGLFLGQGVNIPTRFHGAYFEE